MPLRIEMTDVVREYRAGGQPVRALDSITMQIEGGQLVCVVGPSGAGKSTLLHLLGALDSADSGSIRFDGVEIAKMTDEEQSTFRRHKVGFIFQFFNLLPTLSAWENVAFPSCSTAKDCVGSSPTPFDCWISLTSVTASIIGRLSCQAGKCSGSRWRAH